MTKFIAIAETYINYRFLNAGDAIELPDNFYSPNFKRADGKPMKAPKVAQEPKVATTSETETAPELSYDDEMKLRNRARELGIKNWNSKNAQNLIAEVAALEAQEAQPNLENTSEDEQKENEQPTDEQPMA